ncbi:MAG: hypothetical protein ACYC2Y_08810 [Armatimonadota bacterium]
MDVLYKFVVLLIALYGAILSTYTHFIEKRRKLVVQLVLQKPDYEGARREFCIVIRNPGYQAASIYKFGLLDKRNKNIKGLSYTQEPPYDLLPGHSSDHAIYRGDMVKRLEKHGCSGEVRIRGYCMDGLGKSYKSKPFALNLDDWGKPSSAKVTVFPNNITQ